MNTFMPRIHISKEGRIVGQIAFDNGSPTNLILSHSINDDIREDILRVFDSISGPSNIETFKSGYAKNGYQLYNSDDITDPSLLKQINTKEATPEDIKEARFLFESNLIEDFTEISNEEILNRLVKKEVGGHVSAWRYAKTLAEQQLPLKADHVLKMQQWITDEQSDYQQHFLDPKYRGVLRDCLVSIGGSTKPIVSENEFSAFFKDLNNKMALISRNDLNAILRFAAQSHFTFEEGLHPFADGNGRTGRLIVNYILAFFGYPPLIFTSFDKQKYYSGFKNNTAMEKYFSDKYNEETTVN